MLSKLQERNLPTLLPKGCIAKNWPVRRMELLDILCREEYGYPPSPPLSLQAETVTEEKEFCAGKATMQKLTLTALLDTGSFSFPMTAVIPQTPGPHPFFVLINFRPDVPDRYLPSEEICDRGYAALSFCYEDISPDWADGLTEGLGALLPAEKEKPGKLALWAWAASRVLDWALTQQNLDGNRAAVIGHSRLGKTALLCGALDERFSAVISNDSGCGGAAITRGKTGERVAEITKTFPFWFCENYRQYGHREEEMPFEQHFLLAAIEPRLLLVGSAVKDLWADPASEYLCCAAASKVWKLLGKDGFIHPDRLPEAGDTFRTGDIAYHLRGGAHYLSREDWNRYMDFLDEKGWSGK